MNKYRGSKNSESNDFRIAYLILAYQGPITEDADGFNMRENSLRRDRGLTGITLEFASAGDCYNNINCPGTNITTIPRGGVGSLICQEVIRDIHNFWSTTLTPTDDQGTVAPYEIGHQFGLRGDHSNQITFKIMDYPDTANFQETPYELHPEHINLIRYRVKSPGELN